MRSSILKACDFCGLGAESYAAWRAGDWTWPLPPNKDDQTLIRCNRPTIAWANSLVEAVPPRSAVRTLSSFSV